MGVEKEKVEAKEKEKVREKISRDRNPVPRDMALLQ